MYLLLVPVWYGTSVDAIGSSDEVRVKGWAGSEKILFLALAGTLLRDSYARTKEKSKRKKIPQNEKLSGLAQNH